MTSKEAVNNLKQICTVGWEKEFEAIEKDLKALEIIKNHLEIKSNDIGIEDIFVKGTDTIVIYNENEDFEAVKEVL